MEVRLSRPVRAIAGVAKAGQDEGILVQSMVDARGPQRHVRVQPPEALHAFRCREQAYHPDLAGASFLEPVDSRHRRIRGNYASSENADERRGG